MSGRHFVTGSECGPGGTSCRDVASSELPQEGPRDVALVGMLARDRYVVLNTALGVSYMREGLAIDRCVDAGGSFHYGTKTCDHVVSHPFVPFGDRHPYAFKFAFVSGMAAWAGLFFALKAKERSMS